jgi:hypothetical protein
VEYGPTRTRSPGSEHRWGSQGPTRSWKKGRDVIEMLICGRTSVACP